MDPNANLREQLELLEGARGGDFDAERFVELAEALGEWRQSGGFKPDDALARRFAGLAGELRTLAREQLAERGGDYDPDDWLTLPLEAVAEIVADH